jgi:hypothetical protein
MIDLIDFTWGVAACLFWIAMIKLSVKVVVKRAQMAQVKSKGIRVPGGAGKAKDGQELMGNEALLKAVANALELRTQITAQNKRINLPDQPKVKLREAILTPTEQERGPVPDVPAIKWTNEAINLWLTNRGFDTEYPVQIYQDKNNRNLMFCQPLDPVAFYKRATK